MKRKPYEKRYKPSPLIPLSALVATAMLTYGCLWYERKAQEADAGLPPAPGYESHYDIQHGYEGDPLSRPGRTEGFMSEGKKYFTALMAPDPGYYESTFLPPVTQWLLQQASYFREVNWYEISGTFLEPDPHVGPNQRIEYTNGDSLIFEIASGVVVAVYRHDSLDAPGTKTRFWPPPQTIPSMLGKPIQ